MALLEQCSHSTHDRVLPIVSQQSDVFQVLVRLFNRVKVVNAGTLRAEQETGKRNADQLQTNEAARLSPNAKPPTLKE